MAQTLNDSDYNEFLDILSKGDVTKLPKLIDSYVAKLSNGTQVAVEDVVSELVEATLPLEESEIQSVVFQITQYIDSLILPEAETSDAKITSAKSVFQIDMERIAAKFGLPVRNLDTEIFPIKPENKRTITRSENPTKKISQKDKFVSDAKYKFELILSYLETLGLSLSQASIAIGKMRENSIWATPYVVLELPEQDMAIFVSTDEATYLVKGLNNLDAVIAADKSELKTTFPESVKKYKFNSINPPEYLRRLSFKLAPSIYLQSVVPKLLLKYPTRQSFMDIPYAERTKKIDGLDLDDIAELYTPFSLILRPTKNNHDLSLLADYLYPKTEGSSELEPPEKMTISDWTKQLRVTFKSGAEMMASINRTELKINGWDLNQIAAVVLGDRRKQMLDSYPKFLPVRINKHLAYLAREVFGSNVPEIESYFWTNQELATKIKTQLPNREDIENLHFSKKLTFSIFGLSLYSLYFKFFGETGNPASNKAKLARLLDRIYSQDLVESIAT